MPTSAPPPEPPSQVTDWDGTPHPARDGAFVLRRLQSPEEFDECVALQRQVWGASFAEVVPAGILRVVQYVGGVASGAFTSTGELAGFVFGVSGIRDERLSHWSDTLAVRPAFRNRGLGEDLKRHQRDLLLPLGVERVYWTFDPLESKNAYLNFTRLGVVAGEYRRDFYGATHSELHDGLGTDRLVTVWDIASSRVVSRLGAAASRGGRAGDEIASIPLVNPTTMTPAGPESGEPDLALDAPWVRLTIPADIQHLKVHAPALAAAWRQATRTAFEAYFARGYVAREFLRDGACGHYLLERGTAP
jgi:chorismate synthase